MSRSASGAFLISPAINLMVHSHPPIPTGYVSVTDGGPIRCIPVSPKFTRDRPAVEAGGVGFNRHARVETPGGPPVARLQPSRVGLYWWHQSAAPESQRLSCQPGRHPRCSRHFGNPGILKRHDLPLALFLDDCQRGARLYLARLIAFRETHARMGEDDRDVGAHKPNPARREGCVAALVDRVEDGPVRGLDGRSTVQLPSIDLDQAGILSKPRRDALTVVAIPGDFNLVQYLQHGCLIRSRHRGSSPFARHVRGSPFSASRTPRRAPQNRADRNWWRVCPIPGTTFQSRPVYRA